MYNDERDIPDEDEVEEDDYGMDEEAHDGGECLCHDQQVCPEVWMDAYDGGLL